MTDQVLDIFNNLLTYRKCTVEDIDRHFRCIKNSVKVEDREAYKSRMYQAVSAETAYCLDKYNIFLYYLKETDKVSQGVSFCGVCKPVECCALLIAIFAIEDKETSFIKFLLHKKSDLKYFKTLIHKESYEKNPKAVVIAIHNLRGTFKFLGMI